MEIAVGYLFKDEGTKVLMVFVFNGFINVVDFGYAFKLEAVVFPGPVQVPENVILVEKNLLDSFFLAVYDKALCTVGSYTWFVYNLSTEWTYFMGDPG